MQISLNYQLSTWWFWLLSRYGYDFFMQKKLPLNYDELIKRFQYIDWFGEFNIVKMSAFAPTTVENDDKKVKQCFNAVLFDMDGVLASVGIECHNTCSIIIIYYHY